jgi:hypothetical protein
MTATCPDGAQTRRLPSRFGTGRGGKMKHNSTRALFTYWDQQRANRTAPERADIDPAAIRHILADTFILAADFVEENRFRLAGTKVCALFGREMKDRSFLDLWSEDCRKDVADLLSIVNNEMLGVVAGATGVTARGYEVELEFILLPLAHQGHARVRAVGVMAPLTQPYWLGELSVTGLTLGALRHITEDANTTGVALMAPPPGGRERHGFTVYDGGRPIMTPDEPPSAA